MPNVSWLAALFVLGGAGNGAMNSARAPPRGGGDGGLIGSGYRGEP